MPQGDLILMGPPGSGKGTQARRMVDELGYVQLATGDLFRAHLSQGTELGKLAQTYMSKGQYVPDDVTVKMVRERLAARGARAFAVGHAPQDAHRVRRIPTHGGAG